MSSSTSYSFKKNEFWWDVLVGVEKSCNFAGWLIAFCGYRLDGRLMNILIINYILTTAEKGMITRRASVKDTLICNFARGFVANGHTVTILAGEEFKPTQDETYEGFKIIYFPSRWPRIFRPDLLPWPRGLRQYLREHAAEYDFVISSEVFQVTSLIAARTCPEKLIIWHEMDRHQRKLFKLPARTWYNVIAPLLMRNILVVPRSIPAQQFIKQYSSHVTDEIVDHGANGAVLYPGDEVDDAFIVVSRLVPLKWVNKTINNFARLLQEPGYSHYKLHIVGDGECSDDLKRQVADAGLTESVIFHGFMSHEKMADLLRRSRALLISTSHDGNMVSIPEAIISGTPVITTTIPHSVPYIIKRKLGIARDDWDYTDLMEVASHYDRYHQACLAMRDELTNAGCARKMVEIYRKYLKQGH